MVGKRLSLLKGENMEDRYLFKAKRIDNGEWVVGYYGVIGKRNVIIEKYAENYYCPDTCESRHGNQIHEVNSKTICQCTGLKDKNGKLIWENDIIKTFDAGEEWRLSKIIFADTSLGYGWKTTDIKSLSKYNNNLFKEVSFGSYDSESVEIVGNIFDNAELLESEG